MKKIVFDCDNTFGIKNCDVDDGLALMYLLGSREAEFLGVTSTYGTCGAVWKKHCEAAGKALKDFSRGLCHVCFFRRWGHSRLTPESSRYTPKGLRRTATSRLVAIQAPARAAARAAGMAFLRVGLSR